MLDITDLKVSVRNFLLAQSGITSLVGQQVYFTNLFTLHNPTYPIVNIEQFEGRNLVPAVDRIGLNVFCSSKISYDESDGIWTAVNNVLNNAVFSGNIIMRLQITPINRIVTNNLVVYQTLSRYLGYYIN